MLPIRGICLLCLLQERDTRCICLMSRDCRQPNFSGFQETEPPSRWARRRIGPTCGTICSEQADDLMLRCETWSQQLKAYNISIIPCMPSAPSCCKGSLSHGVPTLPVVHPLAHRCALRCKGCRSEVCRCWSAIVPRTTSTPTDDTRGYATRSAKCTERAAFYAVRGLAVAARSQEC